MSQQGDITASLTLNRQQFSAELKAAVAEAREAAAIINDVLKAITKTTDTRALAQTAQIQQRTINEQKKNEAQVAAIRESNAAKVAKLQEETSRIAQRSAAEQLRAEEEISGVRDLNAAKVKRQLEEAEASTLEAVSRAALAESRAEEVRERNRRAAELHVARLDDLKQRAAQREEARLNREAALETRNAEQELKNFQRLQLKQINSDRLSIQRNFRNNPLGGDISGQLEALQKLERQTESYLNTLDEGTSIWFDYRAALDRVRAAQVQLNQVYERADTRATNRISTDAINKMYELETALKRGTITSADFIESLRSLAIELQKNTVGVEEGTTAYDRLINTMRRIEARRVVEETRQIDLGMQGAADSAERLQQALFIIASGAGLGQLARSLKTAADAAYSNQSALRVLDRELEASGQNVEEARQLFAAFGEQFYINTEDVMAAATPLIRYGFRLEELIPTLEGVAASSLTMGRSATEGINTFSSAVISQNSNLLNSVGILQNFDIAFQRQAKASGIAKDNLDGYQKSLAIANLVLSETGQEVAASAILLEGYGGAVARAGAAQARFQRSVGESILPVMTSFFNALSLVLGIFNQFPQFIRTIIVVTAALTAAVTLLGIAYFTLGALLTNNAALGPVIARLLRSETILRTSLGRAILAQAASLGILNAAEVKARTSALGQAGALSILRAAVILTTNALKGLLVGLTRLLFNPIALGAGALALAFYSIRRNADVLQPALDLLYEATAPLRTAFADLSEWADELNIKIPTLSEAFRFLTVGIAEQAGKAVIFFADQIREIIALAQLADNVRKGMSFGEAFGIFQRQLAQIDADTAEAARSLQNVAASAAVAGTQFENAGSDAETLNDALNRLDPSALAEINGYKDELKAVRLDLVDSDSLQSQIDETVEGFEKLRKKLEDVRKQSTDDPAKQNALKLLIQQLNRQRQEALAAVTDQIVRDAEDRLADAQIEAMEEGDLKVRRQFQRRRVMLTQAFEDYIRGYTGPQEVLQDLIRNHNQQLALLEQEEAQVLEENARQRVQTAQELMDRLASISAELDAAQANNSGNEVEALRQASQERLRQLNIRERDERQQALEAYRSGAIDAQGYESALLVIKENYAALKLQEEESYSDSLEDILRQRRQMIIDTEQQTEQIALEMKKAQQEFEGDDEGALQTQLDMRLSQIRSNLQAELRDETLTAQQRLSIRQRSYQEELTAQQEYEIASITLARSTEQERIASEQRVAAAYSSINISRLGAESQDKAVARAERDAALAAVEANLQQQLLAVGLNAEERTRIEREAAAARAVIEEEYAQKIIEINEGVEEQLRQLRQQRIAAQVENIEGNLPQLRARFAQEREERKRQFAEELAAFDGNAQQRQRLLREQQLREQALTKKHYAEVSEIIKNATETYAQAYQDYLLAVQELQSNARMQELDNLSAIGDARLKLAQLEARLVLENNDLDATEKVSQVSRAYEMQTRALSRQVALQQAKTAELQKQGAPQAEIIASMQAEADARQSVTDSIQGQIDALNKLRDEQEAVISSGQSYLDYAKNLQELGGGTVSRTEELDLLEREGKALAKILRDQEANNASIEERLKTSNRLVEINKELEKSGRYNAFDATSPFGADKALGEYRDKTIEAEKAIEDIDNELAVANQQLAASIIELKESLEAVAEQSSKVDVSIDMEKLKENLAEARQEFSEALGPELVQVALERGKEAGKSLMEGAASGVKAFSSTLYNAVKNALEDVDKLLPHSDAREGPLSRLSHSGKAIPRTMAVNMIAELPVLRDAAMRLASVAAPSTMLPYSMAVPSAGQGGTSYGDTFIQIGDRMLPASQHAEMEARRMGRVAMREGILTARRMGVIR